MSSTHTLLPRGAACSNCRRRKIKCDGKKPKCSPCLNSEPFNDCEYRNEGINETKTLEDQISVLEARVKELESGVVKETGPNASEVYLYAAPSSVQLSASGFEDIPPVVSQMLMHNFIHKSCSLGFFFDRDRFKSSVFHSQGERPTFALLNTTYLWGLHLSSSANPPEQESILISRALQSSAHALSENHSQRVLQCIQSEILLANYFYHAGRILEGKYHATAAASLVLSSSMHKIRSSSPESSAYLVTSTMNSLAAPRDAVEEGERINAFWEVLILDAFWNTVHGVPSAIPYTTAVARVDTPWPQLIGDYTRLPFNPEFRSSSTIQRFLSGNLNDGADSFTSPKAHFARAAILFERATFIRFQLQNNPESQQFHANFLSFDTLIQRFIANLSPPDHALGTPLDHQICLHSLARAVEIQLHFPFASQSVNCRTRIFTSAKAIVLLIDTWQHVLSMEYINPMLAVIWSIACRVFLDKDVRKQYEEAPALCERVMNMMQSYHFPLMKDQLAQVKETFAGTLLTPLHP